MKILTTRDWRLISMLVLGVVFAACSDLNKPSGPSPTAVALPTPLTVQPTLAVAQPTAPAPTPTATPSSSGQDRLVTAAKREGTLTTIGLPHNWCGYGDLISGFKDKYGLTVNELDPGATSKEQIEAIKAIKDQQSPDVIDIRLVSGPEAKRDGILMPYKVATWDQIPDGIKDAEGYWYGGYYQVIAFEVNANVVKNVPQDWADLLKGEYKSQVGLSGDPRQSMEALFAVYGAALANGGSPENAQPGLDFFANLKSAGNLTSVIGTRALVAKGEVPIRLTWDYNALTDQEASNGKPPIVVVVPKTGQIGGAFLQAISANAPHPNAAKLWMEYLFSDEGQIARLKGLCHPARYQAMKQANKIPSGLAGKLTPADSVFLPSPEQLLAAQDIITKNWDSKVGIDIKSAP